MSVKDDAANSFAKFNPSNPDGAYALDLSAPAQRAVAIQLVALDAAATGMDLLKNIALDGKNVRSAKEAGWLTACVPPPAAPAAAWDLGEEGQGLMGSAADTYA